MTEDEFLALVEAAADLDDLLGSRLFRPRRRPERQLQRALTRPRAIRTGAARDRADAHFQDWIKNDIACGGLKLRNRANVPGWARELRRMFLHLPTVELRGRTPLAERIVAPAVAYARGQVQRKLRRAKLHELPTVVSRSLEGELHTTLLRVLKPCLQLHLRAFGSAHRSLFPAPRVSDAQLERTFIAPGARTRLCSLMQAYPVQARLVSQLLKNWTAKVCELTARLERDRRTIDRAFFSGKKAGVLRGLTLRISDPHHGGQETMLLRFQNGCLIYKPRSGRSEADWFALLQWCEGRGFKPSFRQPRLVRRSDYCWMEYVKHLPCRNQAEARRFHRRAGALICVASLLRAVDCHRENLVASRDQPILVDAETLLHPEATSGAPGDECPVLRTGLLPAPLYLSRSRHSISALGGTIPGRHTPSFRGRRLPTSRYAADVLRGAGDMWDLIAGPGRRSGAAFRRRVCKLAHKPWRRIYLPTAIYFDIRDRSLRPHISRSGLERSRAIARDLLRPGVGLTIALREISAIASLDVPYFLAVPALKDRDTNALSRSELLARISAALLT
jgi:hypothetical protein